MLKVFILTLLGLVILVLGAAAAFVLLAERLPMLTKQEKQDMQQERERK